MARKRGRRSSCQPLSEEERRARIRAGIKKLEASQDPEDHILAGRLAQKRCPFPGPSGWTLDPQLNRWRKLGEAAEA